MTNIKIVERNLRIAMKMGWPNAVICHRGVAFDGTASTCAIFEPESNAHQLLGVQSFFLIDIGTGHGWVEASMVRDDYLPVDVMLTCEDKPSPDLITECVLQIADK